MKITGPLGEKDFQKGGCLGDKNIVKVGFLAEHTCILNNREYPPPPPQVCTPPPPSLFTMDIHIYVTGLCIQYGLIPGIKQDTHHTTPESRSFIHRYAVSIGKTNTCC